MATGTIRFTFGAYTTGDIPAPNAPEKWQEDLDQARMRAEGGRPVTVTRQSGTVKDPSLHWDTLEKTYFDALMDFFYTQTIGSENACTFNDWDDDDHTAYYMGGLEKAEGDGETYKLDLKLAIV